MKQKDCGLFWNKSWPRRRSGRPLKRSKSSRRRNWNLFSARARRRTVQRTIQRSCLCQKRPPGQGTPPPIILKIQWEQAGKLVPGDNVYVYIDGQGTAYIVYSVHTTVPIRNRNYPINHSSYGSVDAFYDKAFKGYDINKYKLLGDKEDDHRSYLI